LTKITDDVLYPAGVVSEDLKANRLRLAPPILDELAEEAQLGGDRRDTERGEHIVIGVSAHLVTNDLVGVAFHDALGERSMLSDILEDGEVSWRSLVNVIWLAPVVGPYKVISGCVEVNYEFDLMLSGGDKVPDASRFRL